MRNITDPAVLVQVAAKDKDPILRWTAVGKLDDPGKLGALAARETDPMVCTRILSRLPDASPALLPVAGDLSRSARNAREGIARIKLAVREPRVQIRCPGLQTAVAIDIIGEQYTTMGLGGRRLLIRGEKIAVSLQWQNNPPVQKQWQSAFPKDFLALDGVFPRFQEADVNVGELLEALLRAGDFTPDDLAELVRSKIPEVRTAAQKRQTELTN